MWQKKITTKPKNSNYDKNLSWDKTHKTKTKKKKTWDETQKNYSYKT